MAQVHNEFWNHQEMFGNGELHYIIKFSYFYTIRFIELGVLGNILGKVSRTTRSKERKEKSLSLTYNTRYQKEYNSMEKNFHSSSQSCYSVSWIPIVIPKNIVSGIRYMFFKIWNLFFCEVLHLLHPLILSFEKSASKEIYSVNLRFSFYLYKPNLYWTFRT